MATRRQFLKAGAIAGSGLYVSSKIGFLQRAWAASVPGGTLPPESIPQFVTPLFIPPAMPATNTTNTVDFYRIATRQFRQQILPRSLPRTTVWGYGAIDDPTTFHTPGYTIEATHNRLTRVKWINQLVDGRGNFLPHLLPVDQTLHWANPGGGVNGRDGMGTSHNPYRGPVPIVTHLHGGHSFDYSDGYPESWYLPRANNIPSGYAGDGTWYDFLRRKAASRRGIQWEPGSATFDYFNDQSATTLWVHDHTLGMTRVNVHAGLMAFYLLRGGPGDLPAGILPGPAPEVGPSAGTPFYEIPIVIQDRSFNADGSLFFPDNRAFFEGVARTDLQIPFAGDPACGGASDVSPIWNPEYFGNTMMVNGNTWPYLNVEQRRYRFRFLNACNARTLILKLDPNVPLWQIGSDGGFLARPVQLGQLLLGPAERADVIVDFTHVRGGTPILLQNVGPDSPFGGFPSDPPDEPTTGRVMQFRVVHRQSADTTTPPDQLALPHRTPLGTVTNTRHVSLNEVDSATVNVFTNADGSWVVPITPAPCGSTDPSVAPFGPTEGMLGTLNQDGTGNPLEWMDAVTETPDAHATEIWEIHNFTADAHPIHVHQVEFEVLGRVDASGVERAPESWETGGKDTVLAYPGEITRLKAGFSFAGQYVWHCHILDHEDHDMMRPMRIGPKQPGAPD